jgi:very-short-patch-repair endonuclease
VKFRRQVPIGPYIVDFICHELNLVVEVDGGHHSENAKDEARTKFLNKEGFEVLRFWNNEITENIEGVTRVLKEKLEGMKSKEPE